MNVLAIIGNGRTRVYAPKLGPSLDVWMVNNHALYAEWQCSALFEMHPDALECERYAMDYKLWLRQEHPFPIYQHTPDPRIPAAEPYPLKQIQKLYGRNIFVGEREIVDHYSSTFPYMLALAIYRCYPRIEIYGIDLERGTEYVQHRENVFFWLGIASALNITVIFPEQSELITPSLYPLR